MSATGSKDCNVGAWHKQRFGAGASNREDPDLQAGPAEAVLQVQNDLAALDPEQMVPGAGRIAFRNADGEDIDMPRRDLSACPRWSRSLG